jgi:hypothetical protein
MTFQRRWLRLELRRRWRSLTVVVLLVTVTSGVVLGSLAAARRGATAVDRFAAATLGTDVVVAPNHGGYDWDRIRALPDVAALAVYNQEAALIEPPDPNLEAVVSPQFVRHSGIGVGGHVRIQLNSPAGVDRFYAGEISAPDGPVFDVTIVGVVRTPWTEQGEGGALILSPALFAHYRANLSGAHASAWTWGVTRLRDGPSALPAFTRAIKTDDPSVVVLADPAAEGSRLKQTHFEAGFLTAFGLVVLLAGGFLTALAVHRAVAGATADLAPLRAVGLSARTSAVAGAIGASLASALGATLGAVGAAVSTRWTPDPGFHPDLSFLVGGWVIVLLGVPAGALLATRVSGRARPPGPASGLAALAARWGGPTCGVGFRFALLPHGTGRAARTPLLGAAAGVLGVVAALTLSAGLSGPPSDPRLSGQTYDRVLEFGADGEDYTPAGPVLAAVAAVPGVAAVSDTPLGLAQSRDVDLQLNRIDHDHPLPLVLTRGREPRAAGELVLAPSTIDRLGVDVGERIPVTGERGTRELAVTGVAFTPEARNHSYDVGGWITGPDYDALISGFTFHWGLVQYGPGVDHAAVAAAVDRAALGAEEVDLIALDPFTTGNEDMGTTRDVPLALAALLTVLAVTAVGHGMVDGIRQRRGEIAILRTLGLTPRQTCGAVAVQACLTGLIGVLAGVPLGLAAGRLVWQQVAATRPVLFEPPTPNLTLVLVTPAVLLTALLLAAWPAYRAARIPLGSTLRAE